VLILSGLVIMTIGITLMTQLRADTPLPVFWVWMFITGVGIGPTLSVFTIVVQNAVPFNKLGVATSNLTFFRQIGGSVGLAISGTVFGQSLRDLLPTQVGPVFSQIRAAAPADLQAKFDQFQAGGVPGLDLNNLTGVGQSFGTAIMDLIAKTVPPEGQAGVKQLFAPFIGQLDAAFHQAFALAIGQTFVLAVGACIVAVFFALVMKDIPLRKSFAPEMAPAGKPAVGGEALAR
jgi:hypothetical protein